MSKYETFFLINLGCAKNLVEGEHLAGMLLEGGLQAEQNPSQARVLVVNTCGFIKPAVEESIQAILDLARDKRPDQRLVVVGCLVGRYGKKLARSLPEADLFVSPGELPRLLRHLEQPPADRVALAPARGIFDAASPRALSTGPGWAYLRLADGCDHRCAFCTIPHIRGRLRSRPPADVLAEARALAAGGVRELNLVAQDLTGYGRDLGGHSLLPELIRNIAAIDEISWIRLLYLHPDSLDDLLLETMIDLPAVLPYFDLPLQHLADPVLRAMDRRRSGAELWELINHIRRLEPRAVLRTTLLVGHPGEGEREFAQLVEAVQEIRFHHLGCFAYQPEPGTRSARLQAPPPEVARARQQQIMALQQGISRQHLARLQGQDTQVLVLGPHPDSELVWQGRLASQAPEVDGEVIITQGSARPGTIVPCRITRTHDYDVEADLVEAACHCGHGGHMRLFTN